jgi:hypothetical protein
MIANIPPTKPHLHELAVGVAESCRIVVQSFLPPELWAQAEWRFYLSCRGILEDALQKHSDPLDNTPS